MLITVGMGLASIRPVIQRVSNRMDARTIPTVMNEKEVING